GSTWATRPTTSGSSPSGKKNPEAKLSGRKTRLAITVAARGRARNAIAKPSGAKSNTPPTSVAANESHAVTGSRTSPNAAATAAMTTTTSPAWSTAVADLPARCTQVGNGVAARVRGQPRPRSLATSSPKVKIASDTTP